MTIHEMAEHLILDGLAKHDITIRFCHVSHNALLEYNKIETLLYLFEKKNLFEKKIQLKINIDPSPK